MTHRLAPEACERAAALSGRCAVVTGGASGVGLALGRRLGLAGMAVVLADIDEAALETACRSLAVDGIDVRAVVADVSVAEDNEALAELADGVGPLGAVCLNAGVALVGRSLLETSVDDWAWVLGVNLWGAVHGTRAFVPRLASQGSGHLVYTASIASLLPATSAYQVSKHALDALATAARHELAGLAPDVVVTTLYVGPVASDIAWSHLRRPARWGGPDGSPPDAADVEAADAGARRIGMRPDEVADLAFEAMITERSAVVTHPAQVELLDAHQASLRAALLEAP